MCSSDLSSSKTFTGGVRAQYQLRETLISMHAQLVMGPEVVAGGIHRNLGDEFYADEDGLAFMLKSLNRLRDAALCLQKQLQMEMLAGNETGSFCYSPPDENRNQAISKQIAPLPHAILQRVTEYMEEHLQDNLSLDQLARETDYSRAHFLRMFRATTGKTPHQHLTQRRIERAKSMLLEAEKISLIDVAARCGFSSQSHLTRVFRRQVGATPSEFKRKPGFKNLV